MNWFRIPVIAASAAAALLASGCSSGTSAGPSATPSVASLITNMATAVKQAQSVHLAGAVPNDAQHYQMNLSLTKTGEVSGTIQVGSASFVLLATQGKTYIKVNADFLNYLKVPAAMCSLFCDKYLVAPGSMKSLTSSASFSGIVLPIAQGATPAGLTMSGQATINGQPTWVLDAKDGSKIYIAAQGKPYLLRVTPPGNSSGELDFTQWDSATIPPPPPASQVVDISKLAS